MKYNPNRRSPRLCRILDLKIRVMAAPTDLKPTERKVCCFEEEVSPGWSNNAKSFKYFPSEDLKEINLVMSSPKFHFFVENRDFIKTLLSKGSVFNEAPWVTDYSQMDEGDVLWVQGTKAIHKRGRNVADHPVKHIVTAVIYECEVKVLLHVSESIDKHVRNDLSGYLDAVMNGRSGTAIPSVINDNFICAYIYPFAFKNGRKIASSVKYCLTEFCRLVKDSQVSKYPSDAIVKNPSSLKPSFDSKVQGNGKDCSHSSMNGQSSSNGNDSSSSSIKGNLSSDIITKSFPNMNNSTQKKMKEVVTVTLTTNHEDVSVTEVMNTSKSQEDYKEILHPKDEKPGMKAENECNSFSKQEDESPPSGKGYVSQKNDMADDKQTNYLKSKSGVQSKCASSHTLKNDKKEVADDPTVGLTPVHHLGNSKCPAQGKTSDKNTDGTYAHRVCPKDNDKNTDGTYAHRVGPKVSDTKLRHHSSQGHDDKEEECKQSKTDEHSDQQGKQLLQSQSEKREAKKEPAVSKGETNILKSGVNIKENGNKKSLLAKPKDTPLPKDISDSLASSFLEPVHSEKDECGMERKYYGIVNSKVKEKVLILLGASGSGKTTLINFIANCFTGAKTADDKLIHVAVSLNTVHTRTTTVTAYTFCNDEGEAPITVIDTPGLNDSSGAEIRDHVQSLKMFLANTASQNFEIHALGFVAQAHLVRLTSSERLVMDYISTLFGQSVNDHFITFVTFANNQETPPVIEAMKSYGVNFKLFLKFNNSTLSTEADADIDDIDRVYWRIGLKSWKKCHKFLKDLSALSVNEMKALQNEVYTATVIKSGEQDLQGELLAFIKLHQRHNFTYEEVSKSSDRVWELATVVTHLMSSQASSSLSAEEHLLNTTEKICLERNIPSKKFIHSLLLAPSRKLLPTGISIIRSLAPVYEALKKKKSSNKKNDPKTFMECQQCKGKHTVERVPNSNSLVKKLLMSSSKVIVFKCNDCECDGNLHETLCGGDDPSAEDSFLNTLLQQARSLLGSSLQEFSNPKCKLLEDEYLQHLRKALDGKHKKFLVNLMGNK